MNLLRSRAATILLLVALLAWVGWSVRALDRARNACDEARSAAALADKVPMPGGGFAAADEGAARALLSAWLGDRAVATSVRVSLAPLTATVPGEIRFRLTAHADEAALRRFLHAIEAPGMVHAGRWRLAPDGNGSIALTADLGAYWRKGSARALPAPPVPPDEAGRTLFAAGAATDIAPAAGDVPELVGIAGRLPDDAIAILRLSGGATRALARGAMADGWQVTAIAADRVTLTRGSRVHIAILPPTSR